MEMNHHVILLCTSILSLSEVVKAIPFQSLKTQTLFVDVLSVKEYPREVLLQVKRKKNGNYPFTSVFLYLSVSIGNLIIFFFFFVHLRVFNQTSKGGTFGFGFAVHPSHVWT